VSIFFLRRIPSSSRPLLSGRTSASKISLRQNTRWWCPYACGEMEKGKEYMGTTVATRRRGEVVYVQTSPPSNTEAGILAPPLAASLYNFRCISGFKAAANGGNHRMSSCVRGLGVFRPSSPSPSPLAFADSPSPLFKAAAAGGRHRGCHGA
jgi:hypothetical protein